jgi:hypothetical protein
MKASLRLKPSLKNFQTLFPPGKLLTRDIPSDALLQNPTGCSHLLLTVTHGWDNLAYVRILGQCCSQLPHNLPQPPEHENLPKNKTFTEELSNPVSPRRAVDKGHFFECAPSLKV